jgi:hypothetical protein
MSYIVSFFAALHRPTMEQPFRRTEHTTKEEMLALYYSALSPRLT